jgi:hypothetical protein
MIRYLPLAGLVAAAVGIGTPALAQSSSLIIYGNDRCPANTICVRAPESERYRIPESLRSSEVPASQSPGRAASVSSVGGMNTGPATCSNVGGGGGSNCLKNQLSAARAERKAAATAKAQSAEPQ